MAGSTHGLNAGPAAERLAAVLRGVAGRHGDELARMKTHADVLDRDDAVWHLLLVAFATHGKSSGWKGLIGTPANYRQVTFQALAAVPDADRVAHIERVMRSAQVRYPQKKAVALARNFDLAREMGGPPAARRLLLEAPGRDGKMAFLRGFANVGPKYSRDILMDVYHPDFRECIALDSRVRSVAKDLGVEFRAYEDGEAFFLDAGRRAGLNGWEVDRLIYRYVDEVRAALKSE